MSTSIPILAPTSVWEQNRDREVERQKEREGKAERERERDSDRNNPRVGENRAREMYKRKTHSLRPTCLRSSEKS